MVPDVSTDEGWHLVAGSSSHIHDRQALSAWAHAPGHWSGSGKHTTHGSIRYKLHVDSVLGYGGAGLVERVTVRAVTMARKRIRGGRRATAEMLREEANVMEKLRHRHIVELVGTYTAGRNELCLLTYPAATCDLHGFLADVEDVRAGTAADVRDVGRRFEALGFQGVGGSEKEKVLEGPMGFLAEVLGCVAKAVGFVHGMGVRHQDLKPRNILLSPRQVFLADFGISRDLKDASHSLTEGFAGGTPLYLAPEVAQKEPHNMSPADIYSLGCVFLTVASVLYGAPHGQYETVMGEWDQAKKAMNVATYLSELRSLALKSGKADDHLPTCMPKHLLGLIESMLAQDPKARPTAIQVNESLHDLGGIEQIYHGTCCKKDALYISKLIDTKVQKLTATQATTTKRLEQLEAQHALDQHQITILQRSHAAYQSLLERERNHAVESYKKVNDRQAKDLEAALAARTALEAELAAQLRGGARRPKDRNKLMHNLRRGNERPQAGDDDGSIEDLPPAPRRPSRVPLPVRPSTPLRPRFSRDASSAATLVDSIGSAFSTSTSTSTRVASQGSESARSAASVRSVTPESPTLSKAVVARGEEAGERPAAKPKTWAEMLRRPREREGKMNGQTNGPAREVILGLSIRA